MMSVMNEAPNTLSVRLVAAGQSVRNIYITPGTTLHEIVSDARDDQGRRMVANDGEMEFFVNGASVGQDYAFSDDNQMLVVVGAVYNGS